MKIQKKRTMCLEISGLTPDSMRHSGDMEEIVLSNDDDSLISIGYTSPYVKNVIKDQVVNASRRFASVADSINLMIDKKVITPVMFTDNNNYSHLVEQLNIYQYEKRIMGFYDTDKNSIFLMLNNVSIGSSGSIGNTDVLSLVIHELMHYAFKNSFKIYQGIFDQYMSKFYQRFFDEYLYCNFPEEIIQNYVKSLYNLEANNESDTMVEQLNRILSFAQKNTCNSKLSYANFKALEKLFTYLTEPPNNQVGVKIGKLSKSYFTENMIDSYQRLFTEMNPELGEYYEIRNEELQFRSVFYQEFIASSEVSAMIAGTLVKALVQQQATLKVDNPIAKMINGLARSL